MNQTLQKLNYTFSEILLLIIAFTLPFYQQVSIFAIIALVIAWIVQKKYLSIDITFKNAPFIFILIGFFVLHLVGLLWSDDLQYGWKDIETKLSFLIFPLFLGTTFITEKVINKIKQTFIAGNIIACIYCLITAIINYVHTNDQTVFFYKFYSSLLHVTYFTIYLNLVLLFLLEDAIKHWNSFITLKKTRLIAVMIFIVLNILLLSARTAIATSLITVLFYSIIQIRKYKKGIAILVISLIGVALLNFKITQLYNRYKQVEDVIMQNNPEAKPVEPATPETPAYNSTQSRIEFWKSAAAVIKRNWLIGVGTGDLKEELVKQYQANNFQYGVENRFSPHNQYLHTGVILGVVGITLLLCCLLLPLRLAILQRNWLYICFQVIIILNAITESILERQNGIIFYAFFSVLFYRQSISNPKDELT